MSQPGQDVFMDIGIADDAPKRLTFRLFDDVAPNTSANFRALCTGEKGKSKSGATLHYKGSKFHRIIPNFMCQGGDFTRGDGTGGESIYGRQFADEKFIKKHDAPFKLSMANAGPNTNGSQFFLTTVACPWLDGKHCVFGECTSGQEVIKHMESMGSEGGKPRCTITIVDCGTC